MTLNHVSLCDFRNIEKAEIDFAPGVNVLWGDNAQGKSNILEAIYFCARGKSFRGAAEKQMIRNGTPFASIFAEYQRTDASRTSTLSFTLPVTGRRIMERDGVPEVQLASMVSHLKAVIFTPQHLSLVSGSPAERRAFMDVAIATSYPAYIPFMSTFKKTLEQRNALLKEVGMNGLKADKAVYDVFALHFARASAAVAACRHDFMQRLEVLAREQVQILSGGKDHLELRYIPSGGEPTPLSRALSHPHLGTEGAPDPLYMETLQRRLTADLSAEIAAKTTLYGPHRDDIEILLNGMPARHYASQGQTRSVALALKLAEGQLTYRMLREKPVYLLDDVLSELDEDRRRHLLTELSEDQMILTSCEPDFRVPDLAGYKSVHRIRVKNGRVE